jgi:predicted kinase
VVTVIDVAAYGDGTRSPLLFADLAEQCVQAGLVVILSAGLARVSERAELRARLGEDALVIEAAATSMDVVDRLRKRGFLPVVAPAEH